MTYGGTVIGTIASDGSGGDALVVAFNANADESAVEALLENLTHATSSDAPDADLTLVLQVEDGLGGTSEPHLIAVSIAPETDAPVAVGSGESQANSDIDSRQDDPDVAALSGGGWVAVWTSYGQEIGNNSDGVFGQRFAADGTPLGALALVNGSTASSQADVEVAAYASGDCVVTWIDQNDYSVKARIIRPGGTDSAEIAVNTLATGNVHEPDATILSNGNFLMTWSDANGLDGSGCSIAGQLYDSSGIAIGGQFQVNQDSYSSQQQPSVAAWGAGGFVASYPSCNSSTGYEIVAQYFDAAGQLVDGTKEVSSAGNNSQYYPRISEVAYGDHVVVWTDHSGADGNSYGVFQRVLGDPANDVAEENRPKVNGLDSVSTFAEADLNAAPQILDADVSVAAADSADFDVGSLRREWIIAGEETWDLFPDPDDAAQDSLSIRNQGSAAGQIGLSGSTVSYGGTAIGTVTSDGQDGADLVVAFNANATVAAVQALARNITYANDNITYANDSDDPAASRSYRLIVTDGDGGASVPAVIEVAVPPGAEAPGPVATERQVNTYEIFNQEEPAIAALADGGYVVIWDSYGEDQAHSSYAGVFGQH